MPKPVHAQPPGYGIPPKISKADCRRVERELGVRLPTSYRNLLLTYDWSTLNLSNLEFMASAQELIDGNRASVNPFYEFYKMRHLLEIGSYEADPICIGLKDQNGYEGEIFYMNHDQYPEIEPEFVASSFELLIVCAATDRLMKEDANYYEWDCDQLDRKKLLHDQILDAISRVEPRANKDRFWRYLVGDF